MPALTRSHWQRRYGLWNTVNAVKPVGHRAGLRVDDQERREIRQEDEKACSDRLSRENFRAGT